MEPPIIAASIVVGWLALWDLIFRRAPNWLTIPLLVAGMIASPSHGILVGVSWIVMECAQFPSGDCKAVAAIAAWVPYAVFVPALGVTFLATILIMETRWYNLYHAAHRWPWLAGFSLSLTGSAIWSRMLS